MIMRKVVKVNYHTPNIEEDSAWLSWNFRFLFWDILNIFWISLTDIECGVVLWSKKALFEIIFDDGDSRKIDINKAYLLKHGRVRFTKSARDYQLLYI